MNDGRDCKGRQPDRDQYKAGHGHTTARICAHQSENARVAASFCAGAEGEELETNVLWVLLRNCAN
jgi:hypothetical protein